MSNIPEAIRKQIEDESMKYGDKKGKNTYSFYNTALDLENGFADGAEYGYSLASSEIESLRKEVLNVTLEKCVEFIKSKLEVISIAEDGSIIIRYNPIKNQL